MSASPDQRGLAAELGDLAPALLWTTDPDGGNGACNPAWLAFTGLSAGESAGRGWLEAVHPDDRERRLAVQHEAATAPEAFEVEYRLRHRDGSWRWVLDRGVPLPGAGAGYVGACFDITDRRVEEQELLQSRENLRLALAAGNMGTWVWDRRTGSVTRDRNLQALYGLDLEPAPSSFDEWVHLVHPDDREHLLGEVDRAVAEGGTYELEHRVVRPDGEVRWLSRRGSAYFDDDGEVLGTRGLVVDITERKRAEEERHRLLLAERAARREAELAVGRVARLQAVTAGLADARTAVEVADVIMTQVSEALEADTGALCLLTDGGDQLEVIRHVGYGDVSRIEQFQTFALEAHLPASEALRSGQLVFLRSLEERDQRYPALAGLPTQSRAFAVVPLVVGDQRFGAIALGWHDQRAIDELDRGFLTALSQQAAQALDRAKFHEAEHARAHRHGFLAEASRLLGSSLDYEWALAEVACLAVPDMADAFSVYLEEEGELRLLVAEGTAGDAGTAPPFAWCFPAAALLHVATAGTSLLVGAVDADQRRAWAEDDVHMGVLERLAVCSAVAVPIRIQSEALGVLVLATGSSGRRLGLDDQTFAQDLADRAAAAIANSRSHRARATIAQTLQHSLLPPDVPVLPGLDLAARYRPVSDDVEVGGDFYDVFAAGGARWGVVIGDASGKGVPAASLTALARYTLRTASRGETGPSGVLEVLNNSILDDGAGERFCTVALAFFRYDATGVHFTLACGGQPLPLLVDDHGDVEPVGQPGTAIGLFSDPRLTDVSTRLKPGEMLVFFTDGVTEARSPSGEFADGLIEATLRANAGRPAEMVADAIEEALFAFVGGRPRDDVALLIVRRPPGMFHEHFVPGPRTLPRVRQRLRDWLSGNLSAVPELAGDVLMLANELCTNAERAARTAVDLHVSVADDKVTIDVSDDGPGFGGRTPPIAAPPADAVAGRGMQIVSRLADQSIVRSGSSGTLLRCVIYRPLGSLASEP